MKNEALHVKKLAALLKRLRGGAPEPPPPVDPLTQLVVAFLQWEATAKAAHDAHRRLMAAVVDHNDLRVSHPHEVVALLGPRYPRAEERAMRLHESLQEIFVREHAVSLEPLAGKPRRQVQQYLESLPGMPPYVAALVALMSFGVPAVPVDEKLAALLKREDAAEESASAEDIAAFLGRHVSAEEALAAHLALQTWADAEAPGGAVRPAPTAAAKAEAPARRTTRKTTKKTTKKTSKKTTKKLSKAAEHPTHG